MWERLRRFKNLEPPARGLFLRATALLPVISFSLRIRGFRATQLRLEKYLSNARLGSSSASPSGLDGRATMTARMVKSAAYRSIGKTTCLEQSLALWWLLGRQGIVSSVRKERAKLAKNSKLTHGSNATGWHSTNRTNPIYITRCSMKAFRSSTGQKN